MQQLKVRAQKLAVVAMSQHVRVFSSLPIIPGTKATEGALWSFLAGQNKKVSLIIALGGLFPLALGLEGRFEDPTLFYGPKTAGMILLFTGFVLS
jgi:hypothetical protein